MTRQNENRNKRIADWTICAAYAAAFITLLVGLILKDAFLIAQNALVLFTLAAVHICQRKTRLHLPDMVFLGIVVFVFFSMYLGKAINLYNLIPHWDKILHLASGIFLVPIAYAFYLRLARNTQLLKTHPGLTVWFCFLFAVACAGIWEIYEYTTDHLLGLQSQMNSLDDTMQDIICGTIGGLLASLWLLRYVKYEKGWYFHAITSELDER